MNLAVILLSAVLAMLPFVLIQKNDQSAKSANTLSGYVNTRGINQNSLELLRAEIRAIMQEQGLNGIGLRNGLACALNANDCESGARPTAWATHLMTWHAPLDVATRNRARIVGVSPANFDSQFLQVELKDLTGARTVANTGAIRTVQLKLSQNSFFRNVMTGNHFECMFCHATIYGDVAQYGDNVFTSPIGTVVHGRWMASGDDIPRQWMPKQTESPLSPWTLSADLNDHDDTSPSFSDSLPYQVFGVHSNYWVGAREWKFRHTGPELPWNPQRQEHILPKFDPGAVKWIANGTLRGGRIEVVPFGRNLPPEAVDRIQKIYEGNALLKSTPESPLVIDGRVFFRGDVVISGKVQGKGAIYAGRNIYITDDLTYNSPPPHFDGSENRNRQMDQVNVNGRALANEMRNYDQLALFAVNSIIIGDPYPDDAEGAVGSDAKYIDQVSLDLYYGKLAIEKGTGYPLDCIAISPTECCFVRPWGSPSECIPESASNFNARVQRTLGILPDAQTNTRDYYREAGHFRLPSAYRDNFYPKNWSGTGLQDWINKTTFRAWTRNAAEATTAALADAKGRRPRMKFFSLPIAGANPYAADAWQIPEIMNELDRLTGVPSQVASVPARNGDGSCSDTQASLRTRIEDFIDRCRASLTTGVAGEPNLPGIGATGRTRSSIWSPAGWLPLLIDGAPHPSGGDRRIQRVTCELQFWADQVRNGLPGLVMTDIRYESHLWGATPEVVSLTGCSDYREHEYAKLDSTIPKSDPSVADVYQTYAHSPAQNCQRTTCGGAPLTTLPNWPGRSDVVGGADLSIRLTYGGSQASFAPALWFSTRYWDPAVVPPHNRIEKVQALLFANQFVAVLHDSVADRQLRIHGGVVAKEMAGRFSNKLGWERTYSGNSTPPAELTLGGLSTYRHPSAAVFNGGDHAITPGFIIMQDPRFQFDTDLVNKDFLQVDF